jgi:hypothetical protein
MDGSIAAPVRGDLAGMRACHRHIPFPNNPETGNKSRAVASYECAHRAGHRPADHVRGRPRQLGDVHASAVKLASS